ncbi:MAG TPA: shikimate kinase [Thermoplasmata archaeon]|nr:shikimate kinase [Thermoplasmata archaeon]
MRGVGTATAAVTFVNALATGVGSAAAVELPVEAEVEVEPSVGGVGGRIDVVPPGDTPLVRSAISEGLRTHFPGQDVDVRAVVRSRIPPARGLKSSSAVSAAVLSAVAAAAGRSESALEIARRSAAVSQSIGLSATGAFDDALAATAGGVVVTDNARRTVLRWDPPDPEWQAVLWIPRGDHRPSVVWADRFAASAGEGRRAADAARSGSYLDAMRHNTELVERLVGYDYRGLRTSLRQLGALGSGVSGLGPTLATVADRRHARSIAAALPRGTAEVLTTPFRSRTPEVDSR